MVQIKKAASSITKIPEANTTFTTLSKFASSVAIELHRYKREIGRMSKEEWDPLIEWVYSGHSPYTNGDGVIDDDGWPLDFINTFRGWSNIREYSNQPSDDGVQAFSAISDGDKFDDFPEDFFNATDLPF